MSAKTSPERKRTLARARSRKYAAKKRLDPTVRKADYENNKKYRLEWARRDRVKNPEKYRAHNWRRKGASEPLWPRPAVCELCGQPPRGRKNAGVLNLDHDHKTGVFRGWLCRNCNIAIGLLQDNSDLCIAAAKYLRVRALL